MDSYVYFLDGLNYTTIGISLKINDGKIFALF